VRISSSRTVDTRTPTPTSTTRTQPATKLIHMTTQLNRLTATLTDLFLPIQCAGCGTTGQSLCIRCACAFNGPFDIHRPSTATGPPVRALATYQDTARTVVLCFKERGRRDLALPLGRMMAAVLPTLDDVPPPPDGIWWLVPAPSRPRAARRRGGSHMLALARRMATAMSLRGHPIVVAQALRLARGVRDSAGLGADARIANLTGRVHVRPAATPPLGTRVVLLDDVVTTGATAAACTRALATAGVDVSVVLSLTAT
jgi:predicted amidophosphoribosyltransferase